MLGPHIKAKRMGGEDGILAAYELVPLRMVLRPHTAHHRHYGLKTQILDCAILGPPIVGKRGQNALVLSANTELARLALRAGIRTREPRSGDCLQYDI
jgi:hypothetical protein